MRRTNEGSVEGKTPNGRRTRQSAPENVRKVMENVKIKIQLQREQENEENVRDETLI